MSRSAEGRASSSPWSARETDLLAVTLQLLQQHGYERLTLDAVASTARASKATIYRRWASKAELVLAAFIQGVGHAEKAPDTGTLRGDLMQLGKVVCEHTRKQAGTIRAVLTEIASNPRLADVMRGRLLGERKDLIDHILAQAIERGEITDAAITNELWDLLPGYLLFRSVITGRHPTHRTVQALVDEVLIPSLTRHSQKPFPNRRAGCGDK